jgi:hypothetical protein
MQILTIAELLEGKRLGCPPINVTLKAAPRVKEKPSENLSLFGPEPIRTTHKSTAARSRNR